MGTSASRGGGNAPAGGDWVKAKGRFTRFTRGTGSSVGSAVSAFASAIGGARSVSGGGVSAAGGRAGRLSSSVKPGQALGSFLSGVASEGLDKTLRSFGLGHLIGKEPHEILSEIVDYICGNGGTLDEAIARSAVVEVLAEIFSEDDDAYADLRDRWDAELDADRIVDLLSLFLSQAIFQRILSDLGDLFEKSAVSAFEAERKEQAVLDFIKGMVAFELGEIDPLDFDWQGSDGEELIHRNVAAALGQLQE